MQVYFGYVLSNPLDTPDRFTYKIKNIAMIFMNFFANINDINLRALKLMNADTINIINRPSSLTFDEANSPDHKDIMNFVNYCEFFYLNEK